MRRACFGTSLDIITDATNANTITTRVLTMPHRSRMIAPPYNINYIMHCARSTNNIEGIDISQTTVQ